MGRMGVDQEFLGATVPLPVAPVPVVELPATHHTVLLRPDRRLAAAAVVDIDGAALVDVPREGARWHLDPRVAADQQTGAAVYADNPLDRGHLVRRRDPCWGGAATAALASRQTFSYANAAPQVAVFNQSKELWLGLEDYVLGAADAARARLTVLTGPVLAADDPEYRGCLLPRAFWKVAAWAGADGSLATTGYLLDQSALLDAVLGAAAAAAEPDLGAYRTYQVPVARLADLTGLDLGPLVAAGRLPTVRAAAAVARTGYGVELTGYADVVLGG